MRFTFAIAMASATTTGRWRRHAMRRSISLPAWAAAGHADLGGTLSDAQIHDVIA
jgi:hypothetical protein